MLCSVVLLFSPGTYQYIPKITNTRYPFYLCGVETKREYHGYVNVRSSRLYTKLKVNTERFIWKFDSASRIWFLFWFLEEVFYYSWVKMMISIDSNGRKEENNTIHPVVNTLKTHILITVNIFLFVEKR